MLSCSAEEIRFYCFEEATHEYLPAELFSGCRQFPELRPCRGADARLAACHHASDSVAGERAECKALPTFHPLGGDYAGGTGFPIPRKEYPFHLGAGQSELQ